MRPNTTYRSSAVVFIIHCNLFRLSRSAVFRYIWVHKKKCKGREASLDSVMNYNNIISKNGIIRLKRVHKYVAEFLTYNLYGTVKQMR